MINTEGIIYANEFLLAILQCIPMSKHPGVTHEYVKSDPTVH